ncbi:MAG: sulfatase, partial [Planctomycetes bacterium]|nr:sulfatase [Planctomycetota bacterium]
MTTEREGSAMGREPTSAAAGASARERLSVGGRAAAAAAPVLRCWHRPRPAPARVRRLTRSRAPPMLIAALALVAAQETAPAAPPPRIRRDVLVLTLDTTRRDYLGCYGREPSRTLVLDYLAARSVVFADAITTVPVTLPAHASLFTGLYPTTHGVRYNSGFRLPDEARTLAEMLRDAGYATRAEVAAFVLDPLFGLAQGFDRYRAPPRELSKPGQPAKEGELPAATIVDRVLQDVDELVPGGGPPDGVRKPFFVWAHFYDPHLPYAPKRPPQLTPEQAADPVVLQKALYEQELAELDTELGRLFRGLADKKVMDQLVVVIAADHGESLGDSIEQAHGFFLFDTTVKVPLILRHPALPPQQVDLPVSLIDVAPTLLTTLGIDHGAETFDGIDLVPWLADPGLAPPERALQIETLYAWLNFGWAPQFGCCQGPLKYLRSTREELYDRAADPTESVNLFVPGEARAQGLARRVADHLAQARPLARATATLSEAEKRQLEALGYATGGGTGVELPDDWTQLPDPYLKIAAYEQMNAALAAAAQQGVEATLVALRAAIAADPASAPLHEQLGLFALAGGPTHVAEAAGAFDAALK